MLAKYLAQKTVKNKRYSLGMFETIELRKQAQRTFEECGCDLDKYHQSKFYKDHIEKVYNKGGNIRRNNCLQNTPNLTKTNKSGYNGVCYDKARKKWKAYIHIENKIVNLGRFETIIEAVRARDLANKERTLQLNLA